MAMINTFSAKAKTSFFLNMDPRIIISGRLAPASPDDESKDRSHSHSFSHKGGADGDHRFSPDVHGNTNGCRDRDGPGISRSRQSNNEVLGKKSIDKGSDGCPKEKIPEHALECRHG